MQRSSAKAENGRRSREDFNFIQTNVNRKGLDMNKEFRFSAFSILISTICLLTSLSFVIGCKDSASAPPTAKPYTLPAALTLDASATRTDDGEIVISGRTNLPDGLKFWVQVEDGHLPLGAPKVVASDDAVFVRSGQFASAPLWLSAPNTRFTKKGWPKGVQVDYRQKPFPEGKFSIRFESYFNSSWQTPEVLTTLGGEDGKSLNGSILKKTDADVIDSPKVMDYLLTLPFPALSPSARAINLVRASILNVPDEGRSAGDIQANIDYFLSTPGVRAGKGWSAKVTSPTVYEVSYDFIDGEQGETQGIWTANIVSGEVKYVNKDAKILSWTPNY
jgi:hypothetical protein